MLGSRDLRPGTSTLVGGDRGAGARETGGREGYGRREGRGREAGVVRGREAGDPVRPLQKYRTEQLA